MMISNYLAIYIQRWEMFLGIALLIIVFRFRMGIWGNIRNLSEYFQRRKEVPTAEEKRA
jgi:branched-chain amino acid transport system permease protein